MPHPLPHPLPRPANPGAVERAVRRSQWLAEVASALGEADEAALSLVDRGRDPALARLIRDEILALRHQVDAMRRNGRFEAKEIYPDWIR